MMQAGYDPSNGHHVGPPAVQDALAHLGVWKRIEEVPDRYRLSTFGDTVVADDLWNAFVDEHGDDWGDHSRKYVYGKAWREWREYCEDSDVHAALPDPGDIEAHIREQRSEVNTDQTVYTNRFRPLYRFYEWMTFSVDYPHTYNPALMAVVLNGAAARVWCRRIDDRVYDEYNNDNYGN